MTLDPTDGKGSADPDPQADGPKVILLPPDAAALIDEEEGLAPTANGHDPRKSVQALLDAELSKLEEELDGSAGLPPHVQQFIAAERRGEETMRFSTTPPYNVIEINGERVDEPDVEYFFEGYGRDAKLFRLDEYYNAKRQHASMADQRRAADARKMRAARATRSNFTELEYGFAAVADPMRVLQRALFQEITPNSEFYQIQSSGGRPTPIHIELARSNYNEWREYKIAPISTVQARALTVLADVFPEKQLARWLKHDYSGDESVQAYASFKIGNPTEFAIQHPIPAMVRAILLIKPYNLRWSNYQGYNGMLGYVAGLLSKHKIDPNAIDCDDAGKFLEVTGDCERLTAASDIKVRFKDLAPKPLSTVLGILISSDHRLQAASLLNELGERS